MNQIYFHKHTHTTIHPITLTFDDKKLEKDFRLYFNTHTYITMKFGIALAFILFALYAVLDHYVFTAFEYRLFEIRALTGLFLLLMFLLLHFKKESCTQKLQACSSLLTLVTGIVLVNISSFYPDDTLIYVLYDAGYVLYITAAFSVFGNRFISALILVTGVTFAIGGVLYHNLDTTSFFFLQALFFSTILLTGYSAYMAEYNQRILFLEHIYAQEMEQKLQEQMQELEKLSITDKLTGLYNRTKLEEELKRIYLEFQRYKTPACVILIDIDHFKAVNDTYGHLEGDKVLIKVAKLLQTHTRAVDIVGRWGGEEFLIITPNTTLDHAAILAEKLRKEVAEKDFGIVGKKTISVGISAFKEGASINDVLNAADEALYEAKNSGRNKVVVNR